MPKLLVATGNRHKTEEFRQILSQVAGDWEVQDLKDHPQLVSPEETGLTFVENSRIKALAAADALGPDWLVVADDSGLEVDALDGNPGVWSARYAGPEATDADNRAKLLAELAARGTPAEGRTARFVCSIVLARQGQVLGEFLGKVEGRITDQEVGSGGFGYDSLFVPDGHEATFGELPAAVKNAISHRARASAGLVTYLLQ